jgi:HD superfamily phosphohydrolase YqeK
MKYSYNGKEKVLTLDGEGSLIMTKNDNAIYLSDELISTKDFKTEIINHYVVGSFAKGFKSKIRRTIIVLKFIWIK